MIDYTEIDGNPELRALIFYPRRAMDACPPYASDSLVRVADDIVISCRFYSGDSANPWILYFHGNGEISSDYDDIAPFYLQKNLNVVVADYRGYGLSSGTPTLMDLLKDCHPIFSSVRKELFQRGYTGKLWLMGRSLGSLSALELASSSPDGIKGLILESGFASIVSILRHLFIPLLPDDEGLAERIEKEALAQAGRIFLPALVIHGDRDTLVPFQEARKLYDALGSSQKQLLVIPDADHNSIIFSDPGLYFGAISEFVSGKESE